MSSSKPVSVPLSPIARPPSPDSDSVFLDMDAVPAEMTRMSRLLDWAASYCSPSVIEFVEDNTGLLLVAAAQLFFALMGTTVKYFLSQTDISVFTLITVRMGMTSLGCTITLLILRDPNPFLGPPEVRHLLAVRGTFGFIGLFAGYTALKGLSVSDSVTIQFLVPTCTAVLGYFYLGEILSWKEVVSGFCSLIGVVLVSRPPFLFGHLDDQTPIPPDDVGSLPVPGEAGDVDTPGRMIAVFWTLVTVMTSAVAYVVIRAIGNKASAMHSMAYFSYMCTIVCSLALLVMPGPIVWVTTAKDFFFILIIGVSHPKIREEDLADRAIRFLVSARNLSLH
ncbi:EamA-like transporter family-domain-containing protein [Naematelia encephala]|uniref:EamA-like transporter family-domain-containing protein n=1 Tax=Naematelia encephala TaxID=71784 RepID=A0A1Y2BKT9_9TREE|nr:EamA-like transporter family-domain-containing protein [Naematelia encephala]